MRIAILFALLTASQSRGADDKPTADQLNRKGMILLNDRENEKAVATFTELLKTDPEWVKAYDRRGDAYLKLGKFKEAVVDFDTFLKAEPKFAPEHWRRGIALYYLDRFEDGVKQFETHKTVNPQDVENAVWHYLCNVHVVGKDKAKAALIDVTQDTRVPMAEIQKLYAGKMTPAQVLAVAEKSDANAARGTEARFYAHLYLALWCESEKDVKKRTEHLTLAVEKYKIGHYMWDVGNAHLKVVKSKP